VQAANPPPSSRHWKLEPPSVDENVKEESAELVGLAGLESIVVFGAVRSIVHV
jgi:hypothetical protein